MIKKYKSSFTGEQIDKRLSGDFSEVKVVADGIEANNLSATNIESGSLTSSVGSIDSLTSQHVSSSAATIDSLTAKTISVDDIESNSGKVTINGGNSKIVVDSKQGELSVNGSSKIIATENEVILGERKYSGSYYETVEGGNFTIWLTPLKGDTLEVEYDIDCDWKCDATLYYGKDDSHYSNIYVQNGSTKKDKLIINLFDYRAYELKASTNKRSDDYGGYELSKIILKNLVTYNKATPDVRFGEGVGYTITTNTFNTVDIPLLTTKGVQTEGDLLVCAEDGSLTLKVTKGELTHNGKILADSLKIGNNSDNRYVEVTKEAKLNIGSDTKIGPFGKNSTGSTRPIHNESPKGLQVNGSVKVKELQVGLQKYIDEDGNDITWDDGEFKCYGTSRFYNETTIDRSLRVKSKITADEGATIGGNLDMRGNDIKDVQSIEVEGTSNLRGDVFSNKFKPYNDKIGKLGSDTQRFAYGYIDEVIFDNHHEPQNAVELNIVGSLLYDSSYDCYYSNGKMLRVDAWDSNKFFLVESGTFVTTNTDSIELEEDAIYKITSLKWQQIPLGGGATTYGYTIQRIEKTDLNPQETALYYKEINFRDSYISVEELVPIGEAEELIGEWQFLQDSFPISTGTYICKATDNYGNEMVKFSFTYDASIGNVTVRGHRNDNGIMFTYNAQAGLQVMTPEWYKTIDVSSYKITFLEESFSILTIFNTFAQKIDKKLHITSNVPVSISNNLEVKGKMQSPLTPTVNNKYNLGSATAGWKNAYVNKLYFRTNEEGTDGKPLNLRPLRVNTSSRNDIKLVLGDDKSEYSSQTVFEARDTGGAPCLKLISPNGTEILKADSVDLVLRDPTGHKVFTATSGDEGGVNISDDNLTISGVSKINIIPECSNDIQELDPGEFDRIKFGGEEYVAENNLDNIIFAYKKADSGAEVVPFAITKEGKVYYQGKEIGTGGGSCCDVLFEGQLGITDNECITEAKTLYDILVQAFNDGYKIIHMEMADESYYESGDFNTTLIRTQNKWYEGFKGSGITSHLWYQTINFSIDIKAESMRYYWYKSVYDGESENNYSYMYKATTNNFTYCDDVCHYVYKIIGIK